MLPARLEVAPRLRRLERATLQENVGESGQGCCFWQHFMDHEFHVLCRAIELGWNRVRSKKGWNHVYRATAACFLDRETELKSLRAIEEAGRSLIWPPRSSYRAPAS